MFFDYAHLPIKSYEGENKKVNLSGEEYGAFFPEEHSVLKGIIFETRDVNDMRHLGGAIPQWYTKCFVLKKEEEEWEKYFEGSARNFSIWDLKGNLGCGLCHILVQFESDEIKQKIVSAEERVKLRKRIKENSLQLRGDVLALKKLM